MSVLPVDPSGELSPEDLRNLNAGVKLTPAQIDDVQPFTPGYHPPRSAVKVARDRAQCVRNQKGHSLILNLLLIGPLTLWITTIYYTVSPNHFWHA
jgi:hypothetical protein